ncbi:MAG: hypothetical protein R6U55_01645 [Desulfovermiculus sp.]
MEKLATQLQVHIITADTFGKVQAALEGWACSVKILGQEDQVGQKLAFIQELGADNCVCIGNGRNDRMMLEAAALGLAVMLEEGTSRVSLLTVEFLRDIWLECCGHLSDFYYGSPFTSDENE